MALFSKGIILQQHKEPALSRNIIEFNTAPPVIMDRTISENPSFQDVVEIAKIANIYDERDGELLYKKLSRLKKHQVTALVIDAIDDEPYVSSQIAAVLHMQKEVHGGAMIIAEVLKNTAENVNTFITVYKTLTDLETPIPRSVEKIPIKRITGRYPAEVRIQESFPKEKAIAVVGIGAVIHLYRAITGGVIQNTTFVTVAGNCIANPLNLEVSLGMTVDQVLERCGLADNPNRVVIGGAMTGVSIIDTENTLINHTTRSILAFKRNYKDRHFQCIGCGRCIQQCPSGLNPFLIYKCFHSTVKEIYTDSKYCIGCGTCSYVCPAKLDVSTAVIKTKAKLVEEKGANVKTKKEASDLIEAFMNSMNKRFKGMRPIITTQELPSSAVQSPNENEKVEEVLQDIPKVKSDTHPKTSSKKKNNRGRAK